eukprot:gene2257-17865_t
MASAGNFAVTSSSLARQQDGGESAAALTMKAEELRESNNPRGMVENEGDSSDEDDVHQCGRCKDIFRSLQSYMQHKASKVCRTAKVPQVQKKPEAEEPMPVPPQQQETKAQETRTIKPSNILEEAAKDTIYKQLEILVVEEEPEPETHSTVDVQSISSEQTVSYVALQNKQDQGKVNVPLLVSNETQPGKKGSPTHLTAQGDGLVTTDAKSDAAVNSKKRSKSRQIFQADIQPLTGEMLTADFTQNIDEDNLDEETRKKRRLKMKKQPSSFPCSICKLDFTNKQLMLEHRAKHTKLYKCKVCSEGFYTEEKLNRHNEKESHNYPCECCGKVLVSKASLQRHKVVHGEKNHVCDVCNRAFKTARDMKNHKLGVHSEEKNFLCEHCGKAFARREKLKRHSLIHSPSRPVFTCPFKNHTGCDKVFYRKDKLTRHLYSHSKIKPFKCDHCMKTFARTDNLREHMRTHTGVFRYYCTICGKGQPGPKKYQQHMLKQHSIENFEVPMPIEDNAPSELIEQHKAVVLAETTTRASRGTKGRKKSHMEMGRPHDVEQDFAALHHTTMVTSYSTVSLRDIDPIATMHTGEHHLLQQAAAAHENPSTPTAIHPRPPQGDDSIRVNDHDSSKQEFTVQDLGRNVLEMGRVSVADIARTSVHELARRSIQDLTRNVHDLGRASVGDISHGITTVAGGDEMGRVTPQMNRQEMNRPVQEMTRNDLARAVPELRLKVPEIRQAGPEIIRSITDITRAVQEMPRRGPQEMSRGADMVSNIMVPATHAAERSIMVSTVHADRGNIMTVTSQNDRQNIMPPTSHAERGNIMVPSSHAGERVGIHLLPQSVIQQNMHFTNLLNMNSDLVSIGEAVVRNQGLPVMSSIFKTFHGQSMQ